MSKVELERQIRQAVVGLRSVVSAQGDLLAEPQLVDVSSDYPGSPPLITERTLEFRLPSVAETEDAELWSRYVEDGRKHVDATTLLHLVATKAFLEAQSPRQGEAIRDLAAAVETVLETNAVPQGIRFGPNSDTIAPMYISKLQTSLDWGRMNPDKVILVEGHAADTGSDQWDLDLALRRGKTVANYFVAHGIPTDRIEVVSFGRGKAVCTEKDEACRAQNRRVTVSWKRSAAPFIVETIDCPPAPTLPPGGAGPPTLGHVPSMKRIEGEVRNLDASSRTFEVGDVKVEIDPSTAIFLDCHWASMVDLKEGTKVKAFMGDRGGRYVVTVIEAVSGM